MEFRIAKTEFLRGLRLAQGIADRKSTMPMLANGLLRTQGQSLPCRDLRRRRALRVAPRDEPRAGADRRWEQYRGCSGRVHTAGVWLDTDDRHVPCSRRS